MKVHVERDCTIPLDCPQLCGQTLARHLLRRHRETDCPNVGCPHECGSFLPRDALETHIQDCPNVLVACPTNVCEEMLRRSAVQLHLDRFCLYVSIQCLLGCGYESPRGSMDFHVTEDCPEILEACPHECGAIQRRGDLDTHIADECPTVREPCPHWCGRRLHRFALQDHIEEECEGVRVPCPFECGLNPRRGMLHVHILRECPEAVVDCKLECGAQIKRRLVFEHQNDECPKKPVECPNLCGESPCRESLNAHLEERCPRTLLTCSVPRCGLVLERAAMVKHEEKCRQLREKRNNGEPGMVLHLGWSLSDFESAVSSKKEVYESDVFFFQGVPRVLLFYPRGIGIEHYSTVVPWEHAALFVAGPDKDGQRAVTCDISVAVVRSGKGIRVENVLWNRLAAHESENREGRPEGFLELGNACGFPFLCSTSELVRVSQLSESDTLTVEITLSLRKKLKEKENPTMQDLINMTASPRATVLKNLVSVCKKSKGWGKGKGGSSFLPGRALVCARGETFARQRESRGQQERERETCRSLHLQSSLRQAAEGEESLSGRGPVVEGGKREMNDRIPPEGMDFEYLELERLKTELRIQLRELDLGGLAKDASVPTTLKEALACPQDVIAQLARKGQKEGTPFMEGGQTPSSFCPVCVLIPQSRFERLPKNSRVRYTGPELTDPKSGGRTLLRPGDVGVVQGRYNGGFLRTTFTVDSRVGFFKILSNNLGPSFAWPSDWPELPKLEGESSEGDLEYIRHVQLSVCGKSPWTRLGASAYASAILHERMRRRDNPPSPVDDSESDHASDPDRHGRVPPSRYGTGTEGQ
uniref:TRAF-type domain-containing protein n=1 Tax=Chromera velia CCMP2878 TaxID=1169474 RepID=A0A0G4GWT3_9ALVE|eukprot:Cvel_5326.t1-p1 / transcript=Cvel_5326.t1 / gene=Cvel_5326 / organism=Chromera_velia_CCMP2878 / gene_product=TNF receptor-associated factor family protein, putative / transcript_product=TNF receptor-associated factor family protein, putative / location=Cvel_scaffold247:11758-16078(+) / protein_length=816 / sequence_SO=supercontig / SO=protein_coding / is_pseudo=false